MLRQKLMMIAVCIAPALVGCADIARPDWFSPGTARTQRTRAQRFDPYPNPQVARDDGSARPRDYMNPPPESDRAIRSLPPGTPIDATDRWQASGP